MVQFKLVSAALAAALVLSPVAVSAQMPQLLGGALGAAVGGAKGNAGGAVAGAIIGVAMATILEQLSAAEQQQRQTSLQSAARKGRSSWTTKGTSGKRASYQKVGAVQSFEGKKCQQVKETITLADGKQGTSTENVCFAS